MNALQTYIVTCINEKRAVVICDSVQDAIKAVYPYAVKSVQCMVNRSGYIVFLGK